MGVVERESSAESVKAQGKLEIQTEFADKGADPPPLSIMLHGPPQKSGGWITSRLRWDVCL
jgi:hypothetical protein